MTVKHFQFAHLPAPLREVSEPFGELAQSIIEEIPHSDQRAVALQKLLEAKDAAVRAAMEDPARMERLRGSN